MMVRLKIFKDILSLVFSMVKLEEKPRYQTLGHHPLPNTPGRSSQSFLSCDSPLSQPCGVT